MSEVATDLIEAARESAKRSANSTGDPPLVGAAVRAADGDIYTGSAIITEDGHQSIHAERLAIANAVTAHDDPNPVEAIAINTGFAADEDSPHAHVCGSCLHFIFEFSNGDIPVCIAHMSGVRQTSLHALYPEPWTKNSETGGYQ